MDSQGLKDLRTLWLSQNPCAETPDYRSIVIAMLPQVIIAGNKAFANNASFSHLSNALQLTKLDNYVVEDAERQDAQLILRQGAQAQLPPRK